LRDGEGDADAYQLFKPCDIGYEVSVEVVAIEGAPESGVGSLCEEIVKDVELLDGFGEGCVAGSWQS
jgi:hypothetical protein